MKESDGLNYGLSKSLAENYRIESMEVFDCRHCNIAVKTTDNYLYDAVLCRNCFNARDKHRKENPHSFDEKSEINKLGDQFGQERLTYNPRGVICASCKNIYYLVSEKYRVISLEEQKINYKRSVAFKKHAGKEIKPFKPIAVNFTFSPKGWDNEILCKICFDKFIIKNKEVINKYNKLETCRVSEDLENKRKEDEQAKKDNIKKQQDEIIENRVALFWAVVFIISLIIMGSKMCSFSSTVDTGPVDTYYRR